MTRRYLSHPLVLSLLAIALLAASCGDDTNDDYVSYAGVRIVDLLAEAGVNVEDPAFEGVTVIAPDGYLKDFSADEVKNKYPNGLFYAGLDTATLGTECGFVTYPDTLPAGLTYRYHDNVKVQLNAVLRRSDEPFMPDLGDDLYVLSVQFAL